ncbi:MAG: hypothetical protein ACOX8Q_06100 [Christensenellales bacterium]|jgi:hypothetical protein
MMRYPFNARPVPRHMRNRQIQKQVYKEKKISYEDLLRNASFSPELSFLLAMTLKDGLNQNTVFNMLKNIEPYVSAGDKDAIHSILGAKQVTDDFKKSTPVYTPSHSNAELSEFSKLTRQQALLNILQRYASRDTSMIISNLQKSIEIQENYDRMIKRMQKLRTMGSSSPEQMLEALSMFMPRGELSKLRNMHNMIRMMGSMKNFKPEDIFRFMNVNQK